MVSLGGVRNWFRCMLDAGLSGERTYVHGVTFGSPQIKAAVVVDCSYFENVGHETLFIAVC